MSFNRCASYIWMFLRTIGLMTWCTLTLLVALTVFTASCILLVFDQLPQFGLGCPHQLGDVNGQRVNRPLHGHRGLIIIIVYKGNLESLLLQFLELAHYTY